MSRRRKDEKKGAAAPLERLYEGEAVLAKLLADVGSLAKVGEAVELFRTAQAEGMEADEAIPDLFYEEPRFASADQARRLYSNLFGLWDQIAAGEPGAPKAGRPEGRVRAPAPAPEPISGTLTDDFVEAAFRHLADLPQRDAERWLHRWENTQPELTEALRLEAGDDEAVLENADTLAFEVWAMLELAQPARNRPALLGQFQEALDATDEPEPALARYVEEAVEEAVDESRLDGARPLSQEQAAKVRRIALAVVRSLAQVR
jgi:hypothetical protein